MTKKDPGHRTAREITMERVEQGEGYLVTSSIDRPGRYREGSIGETIRRLSPEDRKKLEELTSDDLKDVRARPFSIYPSKSTTRVFRIPHEKS